MGRIRRAYAEIIYKGKNISKDLQIYLSSLTITDNLSDKLDDLEIKLRSDNLRFLQPEWALKLKEKLTVTLITEDFENENEGKRQLPCGTFYIDDRSFSANYISIKAVSAPAENILDQKNSKHWENITLKALGEEFAKKHKLEFQYLAEDVKLTSVDQDKETDLSFLKKIAEKEGVSVKLSFNKLILLDRTKLEEKMSSRIINLLSQEISEDWSFREKTKDVYDKCEVTYFDLNSCSKETVIYSKEGKESEKKRGEKILKINYKNSSGDLKKLAMKKLKQANRGEIEFNFSIIGDLQITAGVVFELINAGIFNGKYMIEKVTRTLSPFRVEVESYLIKKEEEKNSNSKN